MSLGRLPGGTLEKLAKTLGEASESRPEWPVWVAPWQFPSATLAARTQTRVTELLALAEPPDLVIATDAWVTRVFAAVSLPPAHIAEVADWFELLQLPGGRGPSNRQSKDSRWPWLRAE